MTRNSIRYSILILLAKMLCVAVLVGEPGRCDEPRWPQFRGPGGLASAESQQIPDRFGPNENLVWRQSVPPGHSSPCIWGDRIFVTGHDDQQLHVLCYLRNDGTLLWRKSFPMRGKEEFQHRDCSPAAPTPCTDGQRVYAYFGAYGLVALDFEGNLIWEREFPIAANRFGTGTSPILDGDKLYLVRDVVGLSAAYCLDAATGKEHWSIPRRRALVNFSTPFLWKSINRTELVVAGTSVLSSYDADRGSLLWTVNNLPFIICPSPIATGDILVGGGWTTANIDGAERMKSAFDESTSLTGDEQKDAKAFIRRFDKNQNLTIERDELPESRAKDAFVFLDVDRDGAVGQSDLDQFMSAQPAPGRNVVLAVRAGGNNDITSTHVAWEAKRGLPYVASPVIHQGRLYLVKSGGFVSCLDVTTGKPYYESSRLGIGGEYYATPVGVGDRVLIGAERGTMFVIRAADELDVIARNEFDEEIYATPAVVDNVLYLRTRSHLWAFAEQRKE